jgi:hypothetical protein
MRCPSVGVLSVDPGQIAVPVTVVMLQQLIGWDLSRFDALLQRVQEMGFIRDQSTGTGTRAGL